MAYMSLRSEGRLPRGRHAEALRGVSRFGKNCTPPSNRAWPLGRWSRRKSTTTRRLRSVDGALSRSMLPTRAPQQTAQAHGSRDRPRFRRIRAIFVAVLHAPSSFSGLPRLPGLLLGLSWYFSVTRVEWFGL